MIRLTLNPDFHPTTSTFDKKVVTLGSSKSPDVDLALPDDQLQEVHVKIIEQDGYFFVINQANDPFVALNDRPFGKKEIKTGDHLSIRDDIILFEGENHLAPAPETEEKRSDSWHEDILTNINMNDLVKDIEKLEKKEPSKPWASEKRTAQKSWKSKKQMFVTLGSSLFAVILLFTAGIYLTMSERIEIEEIKASEGVSDVAIALTYAKLNRETPQKLNWSDPNFLNRMLSSITTDKNPEATSIRNDGQFKDWPFIVRIYSSGNLAQFLIIAQPVPSLLHWFIPQKTILLDSSTMQLRRTKNVNDLNRILAKMDSFEGAKAEEVFAFVQDQSLIPLSKLVTKGGNKGFYVPNMLGEERPGAEDLVYNAPRYYPMGEAILNQAIRLLESHGQGKEMTQLMNQLDFVSQLPNCIVYSSKGKERAIEGLKALSTISPEQDFLMGYVELNESGGINGTYLVEEDDKTQAMTKDPVEQIAMQTAQVISESEKALPLLEMAKENQIDNDEDSSEERVDFNHPLFLKFKALMNTRQQNLNFLTEDLIENLKSHSQQPNPQFFEKFQEKLIKYDSENKVQQQKIIQELIVLNQKFSSIPFSEFLDYATAAGMIFLLDENQKQAPQGSILNKVEFEDYLVEIQETLDLIQLDEVVSELSHMLTLKNIPDYQSLILYQNAVSYHTLQKLSHFLLTSSEKENQGDMRDSILHILKSSWISDPDVVEFFLSEYDLSANQKLIP